AVAPRPASEDAPLLLAVQTDLDPHEVRAALTRLLDPARRPDGIVPLASMPLTANGKPDRAAVARRLLAGADTPDGAARTTALTVPAALTGSSHGPVAV